MNTWQTLFGYFFRKTPRCFWKMTSDEAAKFDDVDLQFPDLKSKK
jgi:hypothetical protein